MKYKFAELVVEYEPKFQMLQKRSEKYRCNTEEKSNFEIVLTEEVLEKEVERYHVSMTENHISVLQAKELLEYVLVGSRFHHKLLDFEGCFFHASCVVVDDEAYLFSADSGVGKSTHTGLWMKYLAEKKPYILNDDKPAIRVFEDGIYAYGTPFSGKHDISENKKVKIKGICFLERGETNSIRKLPSGEAIKLFLEQTTNYLGKENMEKLLDVMEKILLQVPIYQLQCNMSEEAVKVSYGGMK